MPSFSEAQKKAEVAAIEYEQRIKEKESMKKMSTIEGMYTKDHTWAIIAVASPQQIRHILQRSLQKPTLTSMLFKKKQKPTR